MTDSVLESSRRDFLATVRDWAPPAVRNVDFAAILDELIRWSRERSTELEARRPGKQRTVSFGLRQTQVVLWAAYPRRSDGAKVVVLPRLFPRLAIDSRGQLLRLLAAAIPSLEIDGTGLLQVPMQRLTRAEASAGFLRLLEAAIVCAKGHHPATA